MKREAAEKEHQLERNLEVQVQDLQRLHEVTLRVVSLRDRTAVLEAILDAALEVGKTEKGSFSLSDPGGESLEIGASRGFPRPFLEAVHRVPAGCGACGLALQRRERVIVRDCQTDPAFAPYREAARLGGFTSCHSVPVITRGGEILGVLTAHYVDLHIPDERELRLFDLYAQMAADFVERARAEEALRLATNNEELTRRKANERARLLSDTLAQLLSEDEPHGMVPALFEKVASHLRADACFHYLVTEETNALRLHSWIGIDEETARSISSMAFGEGICGRAVLARRAIILNDIQNLGEEKAALARGMSFQTYVCHPLIAGDRLLGTLAFASRSRTAFDADEIDFIKVVSQFTAVAFDRSATTRALHERTRALEVLHRVGNALTAELDLKRVIQAVADAGKELTKAAFSAFVSNEKSERVQPSATDPLFAISREVFSDFPLPRNSPILARTFQGEGIVRIDDLLDSPEGAALDGCAGLPGGQLPLRSYLAVPVTSRSGAVLGGLCYGHPAPKVFTAQSESILTALAVQAGMAIDNVKLYSALQRELAQEKQADAINRRLAAVVESSDDAIIAKDMDGTIRSWNKGAEQIFGYTADEVIGQHITILFPPDRHEEESGILARLRRGEKVDHIETIRRHKSGKLINVSLTISPIKDAAGKVIGTSKIARDITDRKRSELQHNLLYELVASANKAESLDDVFEAALSAILRCQSADRASILLCDADGVMRFRAWRGLSDAYRQAVEGHSPWKADDPSPEPVCIADISVVDLNEELRKVIQAEKIRALAFIPITCDSRLLGKFMVYYNEIHHFNAQELRTAMTMASQLAFAIERKKSTEALERLVQQRTALLREAVQQMEEFSYTVSHDLRAPLRGMHGYSTALLEDFGDSLPEEALRYATKISENAARLDRMIMDILTFSRIARADFRPEKIDLGKLVRDLVAQCPELRPQDAEITVEPLHPVMGHEPSLSQAICNLLTNALKFVERGITPKVHLWTERVGGDVRLWVQDNGIGIDPRFHHRLFNMFERLHPKLGYDGTGVGLAIVRKAAERMGGTVGVESDGVRGTRFWIQLKGAEDVCSTITNSEP